MDVVSDLGGFEDRAVQPIREYGRQNALNTFNMDQCTYRLQRYMDSQHTKVKDSKNFFYKQV